MEKNGKMRKKRIMTLTATIIFAMSGSIYAYADAKRLSVDDYAAGIHESDLLFERKYIELHTDNPIGDHRLPDVDVSGLPDSLDLRDIDGKNYVSEVKDQAYWSTCWCFSTMAASETSIAYECGHDYSAGVDNDKYDLSEKQFAWFARYHVPTEGDQSGEGFYAYPDDDDDVSDLSDKVLRAGGFAEYAVSLFSAGVGPVLESEVPYKASSDINYDKICLVAIDVPEDGMLEKSDVTVELYDPKETTTEEVTAQWEEKGYLAVDYYTMFDLYWGTDTDVTNKGLNGKKVCMAYTKYRSLDWTVDEALHFTTDFRATDCSLLPYPALMDDEGAYIFNQTGIDAIKSELSQGRAVSIAYKSDVYTPEYERPSGGPAYINYLDENGNPDNDPKAAIWAHYTYDCDYDPADPDSVNRFVVSDHCVCVVGYDDNFPKEYFIDPKGTIGGDGAFLAKNSWGSSGNSDPAAEWNWGNGGSGYFWISYYDQSLCSPVSFDFDTSGEIGNISNVDMYDYMPAVVPSAAVFEGDVYMADVFEAEENCSVRYIGFETAKAKTEVEYRVYLLNEDAESPVDGVLLAETTEHLNYAGFHMTDLGKDVAIPGGCRYSVVLKAQIDGSSIINYTEDLSEAGVEFYNIRDVVTAYVKTEVNHGECFVGTDLEDNEAWTDWADIVARLKSDNKDFNDDGFEYDNFPIKSYVQVGVVDEEEFENSKAALAAANEAGIEQAPDEGNDNEISAPADPEQPDSLEIGASISEKIPWQAIALCGVVIVLICIGVAVAAVILVIVALVMKKK